MHGSAGSCVATYDVTHQLHATRYRADEKPRRAAALQPAIRRSDGNEQFIGPVGWTILLQRTGENGTRQTECCYKHLSAVRVVLLSTSLAGLPRSLQNTRAAETHTPYHHVPGPPDLPVGVLVHCRSDLGPLG